MIKDNLSKREVFEYVLYQIAVWYKDVFNSQSDTQLNEGNDLTKLKVLKLHFFITAVNAHENRLIEVFDNFYAMPYGHVESDIYNQIGTLKRFEISQWGLKIKENYIDILSKSFEASPQDDDIKQDVDNSIYKLRSINNDLIKYSATDLVELSHNYFSWNCIYASALEQNKYSERIPSEMIINENKYFYLNHRL